MRRQRLGQGLGQTHPFPLKTQPEPPSQLLREQVEGAGLSGSLSGEGLIPFRDALSKDSQLMRDLKFSGQSPAKGFLPGKG